MPNNNPGRRPVTPNREGAFAVSPDWTQMRSSAFEWTSMDEVEQEEPTGRIEDDRELPSVAPSVRAAAYSSIPPLPSMDDVERSLAVARAQQLVEEEQRARSGSNRLSDVLEGMRRRNGQTNTIGLNRYGRSSSPSPYAGYGSPEEDHGRVDNSSQSSPLSGNVEVNSQMVTVAQVFGHRASYPTIEGHPLIVGTHLAGVEIELENIRNSAPNFQYWEAKSDGSLRNGGMEFVCSSPWGGRDLYEAAIEIDGYLFGSNPDESWRCSTHVHVDVRDMNAAQLKRMILAYIFYERVLFKCSGWHRYKNNFCVALGFAQEQLAILSRNWNLPDNEFMRNIAGSWDKYSSLNLLPMQNFGSVEFRISEAKWRKGKLIRLTNRFLSLKELAVNFEGTDHAFIEQLMTTPLHLALRKSLPKVLPPDFQEDLEIGYKLAHDVVSMAPLRRRLSYIHVVQSAGLDDSRRMAVNLNNHYWSHLRAHLEASSGGTWNVEVNKPATVTFAWLYELKEKCREWNITFDLDWFEPTMLVRQQREMLHQYVSEQSSAAPSRSARRRGTEMPYQPSFEEQNDEDDEDEE